MRDVIQHGVSPHPFQKPAPDLGNPKEQVVDQDAAGDVIQNDQEIGPMQVDVEFAYYRPVDVAVYDQCQISAQGGQEGGLGVLDLLQGVAQGEEAQSQRRIAPIESDGEIGPVQAITAGQADGCQDRGRNPHPPAGREKHTHGEQGGKKPQGGVADESPFPFDIHRDFTDDVLDSLRPFQDCMGPQADEQGECREGQVGKNEPAQSFPGGFENRLVLVEHAAFEKEPGHEEQQGIVRNVPSHQARFQRADQAMPVHHVQDHHARRIVYGGVTHSGSLWQVSLRRQNRVERLSLPRSWRL